MGTEYGRYVGFEKVKEGVYVIDVLVKEDEGTYRFLRSEGYKGDNIPTELEDAEGYYTEGKVGSGGSFYGDEFEADKKGGGVVTLYAGGVLRDTSLLRVNYIPEGSMEKYIFLRLKVRLVAEEGENIRYVVDIMTYGRAKGYSSNGQITNEELQDIVDAVHLEILSEVESLGEVVTEYTKYKNKETKNLG